MCPVSGSKGVAHKHVPEFGQARAEFGDFGGIRLRGCSVLVFPFAFLLEVEAKVFEEDNFTRFDRRAGGFNIRAHAIGEELHRLADELGKFFRHRLEREFFHPLAVRTTEMAHEDDRRALVEGVLDGGDRRGDSLRVRDGASGLVLRHIEVHAHEDAFAGKRDVFDGFFHKWRCLRLERISPMGRIGPMGLMESWNSRFARRSCRILG